MYHPVETIEYCLYVSKSDLLVLSNPSETLSLEKNDFHLPITTSCLAVVIPGFKLCKHNTLFIFACQVILFLGIVW